MIEHVWHLDGWGLTVPSELGPVTDIGPEHGCRSELCQHVSHSPAAPDRRWAPPGGMISLWTYRSLFETEYSWYWLPAYEAIVRLERPQHYWAEAFRDYDPPAQVRRALYQLGWAPAWLTPGEDDSGYAG